jgi:hypothetical protein
MQQIAKASDITLAEMQALRRVVAQSFVSKGTLTQLQRDHLSSLGLIHCAMGGVMPTPAGRMVVRM